MSEAVRIRCTKCGGTLEKNESFKVGKTGNFAYICAECLQGYDIIDGQPVRVTDEELVKA